MAGSIVTDTALAALGLLVIVGACELFTNGIEWFGRRCNLSQGVVGSILAAVGTALPETIVPIVAIARRSEAGHAIGIGGILGAPFMLSTLAFFVTGLSVLIFARRRALGRRMSVNTGVLRRDVGAFVVVYSLAVIAAFIHSRDAKIAIGVGLIGVYGLYVALHFRDRRVEEEGEELRALYFCWWSPEDIPRLRFTILQCLVALAAIIFGAHLFVEKLEQICTATGIEPLLISLIVVPIATELPEKFNSVLWIRQSKDTLALGNITGAMVFQSCIPVTIGLVFTGWALTPNALASAVIALISGAVLYGSLVLMHRLSLWVLLGGIVGYAGFLVLILT